MRSLVHVELIKNLEPIKDADRIELATVLGWQVIVKKGEFKIGDKCRFYEIDSKLPEIEEYEFMRKSKFKIKTMKMKGVISQGLVLPYNGNKEVGEDLTKELGVIHIEQETPKEEIKKHKGFFAKWLFIIKKKLGLTPKPVRIPFPRFIKITDQTRVQNIRDLKEMYKNMTKTYFIVPYTEKLDGCSATYYVKGNHFGICSRNFELTRNADGSTSHYFHIAEKYNIEEKLKALKKKKEVDMIYVQGEIIGPGIQKNNYKLQSKEFRLFNAGYSDDLDCGCTSLFSTSEALGIKSVPLLGSVELPDFEDVSNLIKISKRNSSLNKNVKAEGIVIRSIDNKYSFKVINPDYLLENQND